MSQGELKRYEILSKIYKLKEEVRTSNMPTERMAGADEYLNKVLDYLGEFSY
jgi:hypothetical protein